jgi:HlyD family secretion protein
MVIYSYDRFGNKIQAGSTVSRWAPTIAELPDLSTMISKTFINEIDISKIKTGQNARIGIDAFPQKAFNGQVVSVANIGQVLPNGDAKVFEVVIKLSDTDPELRPAMTTSNTITTDSMDDVVIIPLEGVFQNDSVKYVFLKEGNNWVKQIVDFGHENANYVVVQNGLEAEAEISLTPYRNAGDLPFKGLEVYETLKRRAAVEERRIFMMC